jgi:hypothetical protein
MSLNSSFNTPWNLFLWFLGQQKISQSNFQILCLKTLEVAYFLICGLMESIKQVPIFG